MWIRGGLILVVMALCSWAAGAAEPRDVIHVIDLAGREQTPLHQPDHAATLLVFVLTDCPISNAYAPEIQRITAEYSTRDVATFVVYADARLTSTAAQHHAADYGYQGSMICDADKRLAAAVDARVAPEAVVLSRRGQVLYRGRIDDWYADYGQRRVQPTQRDLRDALDAVLAGQPVKQPTTRAIGCLIRP